MRIVKAGKTYENAWVTDLTPTSANIVQLVRAARARWKIENEGVNTQPGLPPISGDQHLSEAFFTLNPIAFFMHQIFELVDGLYQPSSVPAARSGFEVRSAFRLFLFTSWDQVLVA